MKWWCLVLILLILVSCGDDEQEQIKERGVTLNVPIQNEDPDYTPPRPEAILKPTVEEMKKMTPEEVEKVAEQLQKKKTITIQPLPEIDLSKRPPPLSQGKPIEACTQQLTLQNMFPVKK